MSRHVRIESIGEEDEEEFAAWLKRVKRIRRKRKARKSKQRRGSSSSRGGSSSSRGGSSSSRGGSSASEEEEGGAPQYPVSPYAYQYPQPYMAPPMYPPAYPPSYQEQQEEEMAGLRKRPKEARWVKDHPHVPAGRDMAIVTRPGCPTRAACLKLRPDLYLVGAVPKACADPRFGFLPLLAPLMVRAAKRALNQAQNPNGNEGKGFKLFRSQSEKDGSQVTAIGPRVEAPSFVDAPEALDFGFDWED